MVSINIWAIIVSGVLSVVLGFIWYGPLFGKKWMALNGMTMPDPRPPMSVMIKPMIISVIGALILSYTLTYSIAMGGSYLHVQGIMVGLQAGFWNWLGFVVPVYLNSAAWENKGWTLFFINAGYWLVLILIIGMILASWM
jgi:hypothetical protein